MKKTVTVKREDYSKFINILKLFQDSCTDCMINDGIIRQCTDDRRVYVEIDLSSILGETSIDVALLKTKVQLLKSFELDDRAPEVEGENDVVIEIDEEVYKFIDEFSSLTFKKPIKNFMSNKFVDQETFQKNNKLLEENLLFKVSINPYICSRTKVITEGFNNPKLIWKFNDYKVSLHTETKSLESRSVLLKDIPLNNKMEKCHCIMISLPLVLDVNSDVDVSGYSIGDDIITCKFSMKYFGVPITLYTMTKKIKDK